MPKIKRRIKPKAGKDGFRKVREKDLDVAAEYAARDDRFYTMEVSIINGPMGEKFVKRNSVVSRTIQIRGGQTLEQLHEAIFAAFDRFDPHMYEFQIGGKGPMDPKAKKYVLSMSVEDSFSDRKPDEDVARTTVGSLGLKVDQTFVYWFDFGDDWWHKINVLAIEEKATKGKYPKVIRGVGESPPQYLDWDEEEEQTPLAGKVVRLPDVANPTIEQAVEEFLAGQRKRLKPGTIAHYENVISLLQSCLNSYAYQGLSEAESALFDRHYEAEGAKHREFCQIFGPEKITENVGYFLGFFIIRKVMAAKELKAAAGTVTKKLSKWLAEKGYISEDEAQEGAKEGAIAARDLPKAEDAAQMLYQASRGLVLDPGELADEDYIDFDHHAIKKVEPGKLWLEVYEGGTRTIGPIPVPKKATGLLQIGWEISCALGRIQGKWRIVEMGNIYPM